MQNIFIKYTTYDQEVRVYTRVWRENDRQFLPCKSSKFGGERKKKTKKGVFKREAPTPIKTYENENHHRMLQHSQDLHNTKTLNNNNTIIIWHLNRIPCSVLKVTHVTTNQNNSSKNEKKKKSNNNKKQKKKNKTVRREQELQPEGQLYTVQKQMIHFTLVNWHMV